MERKNNLLNSWGKNISEPNNLADAIVENIINTPGKEILKEVKEDFGDPYYKAKIMQNIHKRAKEENEKASLQRKILVVDFDGTLCYGAWPDIKKARQGILHRFVCNYVRYKRRHGWSIHLNTMRENPPHKDKPYLSDAVQWCIDHNIPLNCVNKNPFKMVKEYGWSRKVYGDLYIDDHQIGLIGWLLRRYK